MISSRNKFVCLFVRDQGLSLTLQSFNNVMALLPNVYHPNPPPTGIVPRCSSKLASATYKDSRGLLRLSEYLEYEEYLKYEDDLKYEDSLKYEDNFK